MGVRAVAVACDVTSMDDVRRLVDTAQRELGPIDILVNNAGIEVTASLPGHGFEQIDGIIRTNLNAPIWLTKLVVPGMVERGRGAVVNVSSMAGKSIMPYNAIYGATKHGINGFTGSLRAELDGTGVTAGVVCPGFVGEAGMWADGGGKAPALMREVSPRKVAEAVLKVIGGAPEALVTPGPIRPLLALQELAPGVNKVLLKRMGILQTLRRRAEEYEAHRSTLAADSRPREPVDAGVSE
jgi:short-subunit dehydrogenase